MEYTTHGAKPPSLAEGTVRPRFELASPLGPDAIENKLDRSFAPEALRTAREGWNEMRQAHPDFYTGMTIYGSLVKGRAHEQSDVDAVVFYDPDSAYGKSFDSYAAMVEQPNEDIARHIGKRFRHKAYSDTFQGVGSYTKVAMNERIIDDNIAFAEQATQRPETADGGIDPGLIDLFHMRVGEGDIQAYRQRVVDNLAASAQGETVWREMMNQLKTKEEMRRGAEIHLPGSLAEATDYFGLQQITEKSFDVIPEKIQKLNTRFRRVCRLAGKVLSMLS